MPEIGWPPILGVGHQGDQVFFQTFIVETLELFRIIKILAHGVRWSIVLVQNIHFQLIGPPILILSTAPSCMFNRAFFHGGNRGLFSVTEGTTASGI